MGGVNRLTAYEIYGNPKDIICDATGPDSNGKFVGWITRGPGHNYKPLLNSEPIFNSRKEAILYMKELVEAVRKFIAEELKEKKDPLSLIYSKK
ncbi:MAG: hypothetical protein Q8P76_01925 [bacterium]|nr:hypothetical protein [bacterium]